MRDDEAESRRGGEDRTLQLNLETETAEMAARVGVAKRVANVADGEIGGGAEGKRCERDQPQ